MLLFKFSMNMGVLGLGFADDYVTLIGGTNLLPAFRNQWETRVNKSFYTRQKREN